MTKQKPTPPRRCEYCGGVIPRKGYSPYSYARLKCCSVPCGSKLAARAKREALDARPEKPCLECGTLIPRKMRCGRYKTDAEYDRQKFCGVGCRQAYRVKHPEKYAQVRTPRRKATVRSVVDRGAYLPSPEEIRQACQAIQRGEAVISGRRVRAWSEADYYARAEVLTAGEDFE